MTLLFAITVFLFTLFCAVKAITDQRAKHAAYLNGIDARLEIYAAQTAELNALLEQDKRDAEAACANLINSLS